QRDRGHRKHRPLAGAGVRLAGRRPGGDRRGRCRHHASTLTTIAVFGPLAFVEGLAGRLFRDQALAVVFSLLASLLVALTVVPVLAARDRRPGRLEPFGTRWLLVHYEALLQRALRRRGLVVLLTLLALAGAA
ncbi:efflux RND transporter permease subunit, partial [Rhodothermus marinus]|uniref:efflux RND transporter permease subunit n=1 Tax=Rhodothermus marinus TaxID=29549 RepID=UPI002434529F